jgi:hypothetical protein
VANIHNTNERFSIVQEVLPAMKLVKYYAWERFFESTVRGWGGAGLRQIAAAVRRGGGQRCPVPPRDWLHPWPSPSPGPRP